MVGISKGKLSSRDARIEGSFEEPVTEGISSAKRAEREILVVSDARR